MVKIAADLDRPRRSVLYLPGSNERALEKSKSLPADSLIIDLEDAVAPEAKSAARQAIETKLRSRQEFGDRELTVRINGLDTEWGPEDLRAALHWNIDAIVLPKVETREMVQTVADAMRSAASHLPLWCMIETPRGVLNSLNIADHPQVTCLVMGTSDLAKELRAQQSTDRTSLLPSLSHCLLAARAAGISVLDGVHLDLNDDKGLRAACGVGREMGFDGKTLIHPKQIAAANEMFAPDLATIEWSKRIVAAFERSRAEGLGVTLVDGKLVEHLHVSEATRLLALHERILQRGLNSLQF